MSQTKAQLVDAVDGSIVDADIVGLSSSKLSGTLPAISAANLTNIPAANITGTLPAISGASLTGISQDFVKITDGSWTSAVASVAVDNLDTSTYKYFKMLWNHIPTDQGNRLYFRWRSSGTDATAASYDWNFGRAYGASTNYIAENADKVELTDDMGDDNWEGCQMEFTIYPQGTAENGYHGNALFWHGIYHENSTYVRSVSGSAFYDGGTTYHPNGFKLYMSSGNMDSGNYVVYGLKR